MKAEISKSVAENTTLPKRGQVIIWDSEIKGFGLRLTPGARTYIVQARVNGISRRVSLGQHGIITAEQARKKARIELAAMLEGRDPIIEKKRAEAYAKTLRNITDDYLKDRRELKPSTRADINKHLKGSFADWADRPAVKITRDDVMKRFKSLTDRSPAQANQAFRILRAILNYARGKYQHDNQSIIAENPVHVLSDIKVWNTIKPRSGRIPDDKIGQFWNALQELRNAPDRAVVSRTLADGICFLLLTGARWSEMAELTWNHVNLDEGYWHLPDPKNRNPVTFPLSDAAVKILSERKREEGYVFQARSGDGHIVTARATMALLSDRTKVQVTPHDLRRTFRSIAGKCNIELWRTKLLMNHKLSGDVTITHYTETNDLRYLRPEINRISEWIIRQGAIAAAGNVVSFPAG